MYCGITSGRVFDGELLYTKILEVNLFAFAYRLFHEDFSSIDGALIRRQNKFFTHQAWVDRCNSCVPAWIPRTIWHMNLSLVLHPYPLSTVKIIQWSD